MRDQFRFDATFKGNITFVVLLILIVVACFTSSSFSQVSTAEIEAFASANKGKIRTLRHLVSDSNIKYDVHGNLVGKWHPGLLTWHSAVEIEKIEFKSGILRVAAHRILLNYNRSIHKFALLKTPETLSIEIATTTGDNETLNIQNEWRKAFLGTGEGYPENIQPYWKPFLICLTNPLTEECAFYEKKSWEPDVYNVKGISSSWQPNYPGVYKVGKDVTLPHVRSRSDPEYTQIAQAAKVEGTVLLEAIIDAEGHVQITRVIRPLGWGLEESAAEAVAKWRFDPARKDGEPVSVLLNIEVNFNLRK